MENISNPPTKEDVINSFPELLEIRKNLPPKISDSALTRLNNLHSDIAKFQTMSLEKAIESGEILWKLREAYKYGKYGKWLDFFSSNITLFSYEMGNIYIRLFENKEVAREQISRLLSINKVIAYLRNQKKEAKLFKESEEETKRREETLKTLEDFRVKVKEAKKLLKKHGIKTLKSEFPDKAKLLLEKENEIKESKLISRTKKISRIEKLKVKLEKILSDLKKEEERLQKIDKVIEEKERFIFDFLNE